MNRWELGAAFSIWKEVSTKQREVPILHPVNESPLSVFMHILSAPWNASPESKEVNFEAKLKLLTQNLNFFLNAKAHFLKFWRSEVNWFELCAALQGETWDESL